MFDELKFEILLNDFGIDENKDDIAESINNSGKNSTIHGLKSSNKSFKKLIM